MAVVRLLSMSVEVRQGHGLNEATMLSCQLQPSNQP